MPLAYRTPSAPHIGEPPSALGVAALSSIITVVGLAALLWWATRGMKV